MAVVLLVLSITVVIVVAIGTLGVQHLNHATASLASRSSLYAAEAGVALAMKELAGNNAEGCRSAPPIDGLHATCRLRSREGHRLGGSERPVTS